MNSKTTNTAISLRIAQLILNYISEFLIITCLLHVIRSVLLIWIMFMFSKWLILVGDFYG